MSSTRRLLIVVGIFLCAIAITGCEPVNPTVGQIWLVDETYTPADAAVQARMNETIPKVQFEGIEFKDVVQFLRKTGKVNIHVRWDPLEVAGVEKTTLVTVNLRNVTLAKALRVILDDVGGVTPMCYLIDEGIVAISTEEDLSRYTVTRIYDVRDLIDRPKPDLPDKALLAEVIRDAIHRPIKTPKKDDAETLAEAYQERIEELAEEIMDEFPCRYAYIHDLMEIIRTSVDLTSWRDGEACGEIGSIMAFEDKLIIMQTHKNHRHIERLLSALRGKTPVISSNVLPVQQPPHRLIPPSPEEILAKTPATIPPEKWPAGDKKTLSKPLKILGVRTSRIYVVFLVDCTGSMLGDFGDMVNEQITPALKNLSSEQYFNVICFRGETTLDLFRGKLVQATVDNKQKAVTFLRERGYAEGISPFLPALARAYSALDVANGSDSQVIFLLTDGEFPDSAEIPNIVARRSKHIKIPIHTHHYHVSNESAKLLKRLSEITGGKYKAISLE